MSLDATAAVTELIIEIFRLNGRLLAAGDALVADIGLTSARWQVLGAIALCQEPLPVARLARTMGLTRQSVQRLTNEMERDRLVELKSNPHHRRSKLVVLTTRGQKTYRAAIERQLPWASALADGLTAARILAANAVLKTVRSRLEAADLEE
jgi:DNA-binding MarR family transcriptional regulator